MTLVEFDLAWDTDLIPDKHSYEVENNYMDWEALELSKKKLFIALSHIKKVDDKIG